MYHCIGLKLIRFSNKNQTHSPKCTDTIHSYRKTKTQLNENREFDQAHPLNQVLLFKNHMHEN